MFLQQLKLKDHKLINWTVPVLISKYRCYFWTVFTFHVCNKRNNGADETPWHSKFHKYRSFTNINVLFFDKNVLSTIKTHTYDGY